MLSFEITDSGRAIQIYCDARGMTTLVDALHRAISPEGHVHLRSPAGGGRALDDANPWGTPAVSEVIITSVEDDDQS